MLHARAVEAPYARKEQVLPSECKSGSKKEGEELKCKTARSGRAGTMSETDNRGSSQALKVRWSKKVAVDRDLSSNDRPPNHVLPK